MEGSTKIKKTKPFKGKSIIENYVFIRYNMSILF